MGLQWLSDFQKESEKAPDYAEKTLAAYRLGMRAKGAIVGVRVLVAAECCEEAQALPVTAVYHPDEAPIIPLQSCPLGAGCRCVYRPVMRYEQTQDDE